jgi:hypothetical protein
MVVLIHNNEPLEKHKKILGTGSSVVDLKDFFSDSDLERNGDIIKDTTPILQFWSEIQQTWHIYSQRPQTVEWGNTGIGG